MFEFTLLLAITWGMDIIFIYIVALECKQERKKIYGEN